MPGTVQIVQRPTLAPSTCLISGADNGPQIDTGRDIHRYGRVYLRIADLGPALREAGWVPREEIAALEARLEKAERLAESNADKAAAFERVASAVGPYMPTPPPEIQTKIVSRYHAPTHDDIRDYLERHPDVFETFRPAPPGSVEEWNRLYRSTPKAAPAPPGEGSPGEVEPEPATSSDEPPATAVVLGQEVNLDAVLENSVKDIAAFVEGHEAELASPLAERETWRAEQAGRAPRKGVLNIDNPDAGPERNDG